MRSIIVDIEISYLPKVHMYFRLILISIENPEIVILNSKLKSIRSSWNKFRPLASRYLGNKSEVLKGAINKKDIYK